MNFVKLNNDKNFDGYLSIMQVQSEQIISFMNHVFFAYFERKGAVKPAAVVVNARHRRLKCANCLITILE